MKKNYWIYSLLLIGILSVIAVSCSKDDDPVYPKIRLKTGANLNSGAHIYYLALSKNTDFSNFTSTQLISYRKTDADWYIDGDVIPFTTEYKEFSKPVGEYYVIMSASGLVMTTSVTIANEDQTFVISGTTYGGISLTITKP